MSIDNKFYVLFPKDNRLRNFLNSLKVLCDCTQRTEAHITVRGPYKIKLSKDVVANLNSIILNEELYISNVENFFPFNNQNTVFFKCDENDNLKKIWNKLTYNEFKPHITMYDGKDSDLAVKLFNLLSKNFRPFIYEVEKISYLMPKTDDSLMFYHLGNRFDYDYFSEFLGIDLDNAKVKKLTVKKRLEYIDELTKLYFSDEKRHTISNKVFMKWG